MNRAVETLTQLVNDLPGQIDAALAIEVNTGNVNASGNVTASGTVNGVGGLRSSGAAGTSLASVPGNRQTVWQIYDGSNIGLYGYAPSSITTKTDIEEVPYSPESFLRCMAFLYVYKGQVAIRDDPDNEYYDPGYEVPSEAGYMAQHLIANGLGQFVTMNGAEPIGIDYASFAAVGMTVIGRAHAEQMAAQAEEIKALTARVAAMGG